VILQELLKLVNAEIKGNPRTEITGVSAIEDAKSGDLVFILDDKFLPLALKSKAAAVVAKIGAQVEGKPALLLKNPRLAMSKILKLFAPQVEIERGKNEKAFIHKTAKLGKNVSVGPFVYIGPRVTIGDNTLLYPNVTIYQNSVIGKNCILHAGAVVGMDGFGFEDTDEHFEKIPQIGKVIIGDNVEIYSNTCIARGTIGNTIIHSGVKIDNLVHVAHNCEIGENTVIASSCGLSGGVKLGKHVMVAGQVGFNGHITVGDNCLILARSGVTKDIPANAVISGFPAIDHKEDLKKQAIISRLSRNKKNS
jgi:UDP-3-O-[3-hydroxymyristoyl] glucosamine N-acyltransferase